MTLTTTATTLETFLVSDEFKTGVIQSTQASFAGNGYSVELFLDGTFRILSDNQIGNRYESAGVILGLPTIDTDDMTSYVSGGTGTQEEFLAEAFYAEEEELKADMRSKL